MDREELLELILGAIAEYKDVDTGEIDASDSFSDMELEPVDVMSIVREVTGELDMEAPRGYEFTQTPEELVDFICG